MTYYKPIQTPLQRQARAFARILHNVHAKHPFWSDHRCRELTAKIVEERFK